MYWDLRAVRRTELFWSRMSISREQIERGGTLIWEQIRREVVKRIQHEAMALRLDPEDFQFEEEDAEPHGGEAIVAITARWRPTHRDGVLHFQDRKPHLVPMRDSRPFPWMEVQVQQPLWWRAQPSSPQQDTEMPSLTERLPLSGWDDTNRLWVYAQEGADLSELEPR